MCNLSGVEDVFLLEEITETKLAIRRKEGREVQTYERGIRRGPQRPGGQSPGSLSPYLEGNRKAWESRDWLRSGWKGGGGSQKQDEEEVAVIPARVLGWRPQQEKEVDGSDNREGEERGHLHFHQPQAGCWCLLTKKPKGRVCGLEHRCGVSARTALTCAPGLPLFTPSGSF